MDYYLRSRCMCRPGKDVFEKEHNDHYACMQTSLPLQSKGKATDSSLYSLTPMTSLAMLPGLRYHIVSPLTLNISVSPPPFIEPERMKDKIDLGRFWIWGTKRQQSFVWIGKAAGRMSRGIFLILCTLVWISLWLVLHFIVWEIDKAKKYQSSGSMTEL